MAAYPICPKCEGHNFEVKEFKTMNDGTIVYLVCCFHCGTVVGSFSSK